MGEFLLTDADEAFRSGLWRLDAGSTFAERLPKTTVGTTITRRPFGSVASVALNGRTSVGFGVTVAMEGAVAAAVATA